MPQDLTFWILAGLATFIVGSSKGGLPLLGMLSVPLMTLAMPATKAAGLLLPLYVLSDIYGLWLFRKDYSLRNLAILVPATTLGVAIGWAAAKVTSEDLVKLMVGLIGLSYAAIAAYNYKRELPPKPADIGRGTFWGTVAGFTSFVSHSGGPPFQMYVLPQKLDKIAFAGTSTILFAYVNAIKLVPYWFLGQINTGSLRECALLAPLALFGAWAGYKLTMVLPEGLFFRAVEVALFLLSIMLIWDVAAVWL
jgi:uncharacterized membrane protein YfcA